MKKGDVEIANHFSKKYGNKGLPFKRQQIIVYYTNHDDTVIFSQCTTGTLIIGICGSIGFTSGSTNVNHNIPLTSISGSVLVESTYYLRLILYYIYKHLMFFSVIS